MTNEELREELIRIEQLQRKDKEEAQEHIATMNGEMGSVKTDIRWLKKISWGTLAGIGTALVGIIVLIVQNSISR